MCWLCALCDVSVSVGFFKYVVVVFAPPVYEQNEEEYYDGYNDVNDKNDND